MLKEILKYLVVEDFICFENLRMLYMCVFVF